MKINSILLAAGLTALATSAQAFNMFNPGDWFDNDNDRHDRYYDRGYYGGYGPYGWGGGPWGGGPWGGGPWGGGPYGWGGGYPPAIVVNPGQGSSSPPPPKPPE